MAWSYRSAPRKHGRRAVGEDRIKNGNAVLFTNISDTVSRNGSVLSMTSSAYNQAISYQGRRGLLISIGTYDSSSGSLRSNMYSAGCRRARDPFPSNQQDGDKAAATALPASSRAVAAGASRSFPRYSGKRTNGKSHHHQYRPAEPNLPRIACHTGACRPTTAGFGSGRRLPSARTPRPGRVWDITG